YWRAPSRAVRCGRRAPAPPRRGQGPSSRAGRCGRPRGGRPGCVARLCAGCGHLSCCLPTLRNPAAPTVGAQGCFTKCDANENEDTATPLATGLFFSAGAGDAASVPAVCEYRVAELSSWEAHGV